jgi:hypothetical protein
MARTVGLPSPFAAVIARADRARLRDAPATLRAPADTHRGGRRDPASGTF